MQRHHRSTILRVALSALLVGSLTFVMVALNGCGCEDYAATSISAIPVDRAGEPLNDCFTFEYRRTGLGEDAWRDCDVQCSDDQQSQTVACGREVVGTFDVRGTNGELSGMVTDIRVTEDRCHAQTRTVGVLMQ